MSKPNKDRLLFDALTALAFADGYLEGLGRTSAVISDSYVRLYNDMQEIGLISKDSVSTAGKEE